MISDRPARNANEESARAELVALCRAVLAGELSFFEGALRIAPLQSCIGVREHDPDFTPFVVIRSDTDHLPPQSVRHRWSPEALQQLEPEFEKTEVWGKKYATAACENLIKRFSIG